MSIANDNSLNFDQKRDILINKFVNDMIEIKVKDVRNVINNDILTHTDEAINIIKSKFTDEHIKNFINILEKDITTIIYNRIIDLLVINRDNTIHGKINGVINEAFNKIVASSYNDIQKKIQDVFTVSAKTELFTKIQVLPTVLKRDVLSNVTNDSYKLLEPIYIDNINKEVETMKNKLKDIKL